jgi:hypothetical protein
VVNCEMVVGKDELLLVPFVVHLIAQCFHRCHIWD